MGAILNVHYLSNAPRRWLYLNAAVRGELGWLVAEAPMETRVSDGFIWSRWAAEDFLATSRKRGNTSALLSIAAWQKHLAEHSANINCYEKRNTPTMV
ncbi:hypothetical protein NPX13_g6865 [Xylaria arbuscula]|uniref:Uncharacterized protein n=1 Tax=Xylaria arbuscula TaxID=114810 RepID=A0A9W8NBS0_9PEZI|nr:hypothetical protein NPX13_g6865 [Xylaria arbuscula]